MINASLQVIALIEAGRAGEVWDGASEVTKKAAPKSNFVSQIAQDRQQVGEAKYRQRVTITRTRRAEGGPIPAGNYVSVVYATRFASSEQPIRELISFRLDEDSVWRVSGYTVR